jgi:hypothetical protein
MSATESTSLIRHDLVNTEHLMALKGMTVDTIAYFLHDHPEVRAVVELILEGEDGLKPAEQGAT